MGDTLLLFLASLLLTSCVSVATIDIHVLEPAPDPVTPAISSVVLINRTIVDETAETESGDTIMPDNLKEIFNQVTTEIIFSLAAILNESPGIEHIDEYMLLEIPTLDPDISPELLEPDFVVHICDSFSADGIISLESVYFQHSDTIRPAGSRTERYYLGEVIVDVTAMWRIYEKYEGRPADENIWQDTLLWQEASYYPTGIPDYLPSAKEALMEAAYYTALSQARRIAPYWTIAERYYFARGSRNLRKASYLLKNDQFENAEKIYNDLLERRNKNIVAAAYHNLAFIDEMRGAYINALKLARIAYQKRRHPVTAGYIDILKERLDKAGELDRQLEEKN